MKQTKLILMEGLPSTGKSTNSGFLLDQLEKNGRRSKWIHEVARPHPTLFFFEASLNEMEYRDYILRYPQTASILGELAIKHGDSYGIDLLEMEWNLANFFSTEAVFDLKRYDVWNYSIDRYAETAAEKSVNEQEGLGFCRTFIEYRLHIHKKLSIKRGSKAWIKKQRI